MEQWCIILKYLTTFNRTKVECKYQLLIGGLELVLTFNRTKVECK